MSYVTLPADKVKAACESLITYVECLHLTNQISGVLQSFGVDEQIVAQQLLALANTGEPVTITHEHSFILEYIDEN